MLVAELRLETHSFIPALTAPNISLLCVSKFLKVSTGTPTFLSISARTASSDAKSSMVAPFLFFSLSVRLFIILSIVLLLCVTSGTNFLNTVSS